MVLANSKRGREPWRGKTGFGGLICCGGGVEIDSAGRCGDEQKGNMTI